MGSGIRWSFTFWKIQYFLETPCNLFLHRDLCHNPSWFHQCTSPKTDLKYLMTLKSTWTPFLKSSRCCPYQRIWRRIKDRFRCLRLSFKGSMQRTNCSWSDRFDLCQLSPVFYWVTSVRRFHVVFTGPSAVHPLSNIHRRFHRSA